jgi:hypothetical protein
MSSDCHAVASSRSGSLTPRCSLTAPKITRAHPENSLPRPDTLDRMCSALLRYPNVVACFIGYARRRGAPTPRLALVCCVSRKRDGLPRESRLPSHLTWVDSTGHPRRLAVDVEELRGFTYEAGPVIGPGDSVRRANGDIATIGVALNHPVHGPVVTTAGHLFLHGFSERENVTLTSAGTAYAAIAVRVNMTSLVDYALIQTVDHLQCDNLYVDQYPVRALYQATSDDLGAELLILTNDGTPRAVACRGVSARATIDGRPMQDLILTDWRTKAGDSGACLIDDEQRAWGLLVGRLDTATYSLSAFAPAHVPIFQENATFIQ